MKALIIAALVLAACGSGAEKKADQPAPPRHAALPMSRPYEAVRAALADDSLLGARTAAAELVTLAFDPGVEAAARAIVAAADIEAARTAFGALSKLYLELLAKAPPEVTNSLFAFRCPMVEGYQKWVQLDAELKNPYMGKRMLECGSKTELTP